ncbi:MAG: hypothetical protein QG566_134 [Patescibacteria group bacterium]|jgi:topoisomerase IA-like protein|nr:hypothetical protein [Patescibacteria group bacterium]
MTKRIISFFIFLILVVSPVNSVLEVQQAHGATTKSTVKKSTTQKATTKKKSTKKKVTKKKPKVVLAPPLFTLETAPHSPKPSSKSKSKKKTTTKKTVTKKKA